MWTAAFFLYSELLVRMMKNELVAGCTGPAPVLQHARVAFLVCVLDVKSVVSQIAAARHVPTLRGMQKLELSWAEPASKVTLLSWWFPPLNVGSLLIVGATFKRHPTFKKKLPLSLSFFFMLNMNFQALGSSALAVLLFNLFIFLWVLFLNNSINLSNKSSKVLRNKPPMVLQQLNQGSQWVWFPIMMVTWIWYILPGLIVFHKNSCWHFPWFKFRTWHQWRWN